MQDCLPFDKQELTLLRRVQDMLQRADAGAPPAFTGFLSLRQRELVDQSLRRQQHENTLFFGGYPAGERVVFGVFPEFTPPSPADFPVVGLVFRFRSQDKLSHRDFLGAILGLGLSRETVGDILVEDGRAVGFFTEHAGRLVTEQLSLVGRVGVAVEPYCGEDLPAPKLEELVLNVASRRLDCVVAALCKLSREKSAALIQGKLVQVNGVVCESAAFSLSEDCILSVRGHGRFKIGGEVRRTKKDRLCIACQKYIS